jgi:DNA-directed RNA polymerase subunit N (RpoN/RPB10)
MTRIICTTCGEMLGSKVLVYERKLKEACNKFNLDYDTLSKGYIEKDDKYIEAQKKIVQDLCENPCCVVALICGVTIEKLVV